MDRLLGAVIVALVMVLVTHFAGGTFERLLPWHHIKSLWLLVPMSLASVFVFHGLLQHKLSKWLRGYFVRRDRDDYVRNFERMSSKPYSDYTEAA
jgi:hypothetical protein